MADKVKFYAPKHPSLSIGAGGVLRQFSHGVLEVDEDVASGLRKEGTGFGIYFYEVGKPMPDGKECKLPE